VNSTAVTANDAAIGSHSSWKLDGPLVAGSASDLFHLARAPKTQRPYPRSRRPIANRSYGTTGRPRAARASTCGKSPFNGSRWPSTGL